MEFLAKRTAPESTHSPAADERYSGPVLRATAVCLGGDFRNGLHRRNRKRGGPAHHSRGVDRFALHSADLLFRRQNTERAIRAADFYHVHAVSGGPAVVIQ